MEKFVQQSDLEIQKDPPEPQVDTATLIPGWLKIRDDIEHADSQDWFILDADFNISNMPNAVDSEIEQKCGIEKLFAINTNDLGLNPQGQEVNFKRKITKSCQVHKGKFLTREEAVKRMVPFLKSQRDLMLGFVVPPKPVVVPRPPPPDLSHLSCLFY